MSNLYLKAQQNLKISEGNASNYYFKNHKTDGSRSVTNIRGKYKLSLLTPSASNLSLIKSPLNNESILPEIVTRYNTELDPKSTQQRFASPKVALKLAPIRSTRVRNAQSLDLRSLRHQNSQKDDAFEYLTEM